MHCACAATDCLRSGLQSGSAPYTTVAEVLRLNRDQGAQRPASARRSLTGAARRRLGASSMAGEDAADAIDVDAAVDYPAIVDAEAAAPNPPDMDNRQLTDLYKTISASSWSVPVEDSAGLDHCVRDAVDALEAGVDDKSEKCQHFYQSVLTMAFERLMTERAVKGWNHNTQQNVFARTEQFIQFYVRPRPCLPIGCPRIAGADTAGCPAPLQTGSEAGVERPSPRLRAGRLERMLREPEPRLQDVLGRRQLFPQQERRQCLVLPTRVRPRPRPRPLATCCVRVRAPAQISHGCVY